MSLYPNATHILQPCDVGIFRPLKRSWQTKVAEHAQKTSQAITKSNFAPLFNAAFIEASKPDIIKKAFETCGLYPFNPDNVNYAKCISQRRKVMKNNLELSNDRNLKSVILLNVVKYTTRNFRYVS